MEIFMPGELENLSDENVYLRGCSCDDRDLEDEPIRNCGCSKKDMDIYCEKKFKMALRVIKESISDEKYDETFYNYLIKNADTDEEKSIIKSIRDDEAKHNMLLRRVYSDFTGKDIEVDDEVDFERPKSYINGIKKAHNGELKAVEKYRRVLTAMPNQYYRDIIFEIMSDEMKHASWYNYILFLNLEKKCM